MSLYLLSAELFPPRQIVTALYMAKGRGGSLPKAQLHTAPNPSRGKHYDWQWLSRDDLG